MLTFILLLFFLMIPIVLIKLFKGFFGVVLGLVRLYLYLFLLLLVMALVTAGYFASSRSASIHEFHEAGQFPPQGNIEDFANELLRKYYNPNYHVATDVEMRWSDYYLDHIQKERKKWDYYPYIVVGNFTGNGRHDIAVFAVMKGNRFVHRFIIFNSNDWSHPYDLGNIADGIALFPKSNISSHWENHPLDMRHDGVVTFKFESSAILCYWDGREYNRYWISD
ncbi:MAG TPA: hypothetical protein VLX91_05915 [Candidatus Acidoferrales bacterium]|nr:hypothetical protein [Candidatus Acidoferrales bacterium]